MWTFPRASEDGAGPVLPSAALPSSGSPQQWLPSLPAACTRAVARQLAEPDARLREMSGSCPGLVPPAEPDARLREMSGSCPGLVPPAVV